MPLRRLRTALATVRGRDELVLSGEALIDKLAVLVPPPSIHLVRFHGVFAPNAKLRSQIVPPPSVAVDEEHDKHRASRPCDQTRTASIGGPARCRS